MRHSNRNDNVFETRFVDFSKVTIENMTEFEGGSLRVEAVLRGVRKAIFNVKQDDIKKKLEACAADTVGITVDLGTNEIVEVWEETQ